MGGRDENWMNTVYLGELLKTKRLLGPVTNTTKLVKYLTSWFGWHDIGPLLHMSESKLIMIILSSFSEEH